MAQPLLKDPIVSAGPIRTGAGTGTLTVDKLTHFTTAQDYTLTCISTAPDSLFSVVGSLDGPVGIAKVGTQFFDDDLKIFLTIQQGPTLFIVGDKFDLTVENGSDLNQDNIDSYDELTQKNFGEGTKGSLSGDHNLRFSDTDINARLLIADLLFVATTAGDAGNDVQIAYADAIAAVASTGSIGGFAWTAATAGTGGNSITVQLISDVLAGAETATVLSNAITIHLQGSVSTKNQILAALNANPAVAALASYSMLGSGTDTVAAPVAATNLTGGANAIGSAGSPGVVVAGNLITIRFPAGKVTATEIKTAFDGSVAALALASCTIIGNGAEPQSEPRGAENLSGGLTKTFAFNERELTDDSNFYEGNASILAEDVTAQGRLAVSKDAAFGGQIRTPGIPDIQTYIQRLMQDQRISLRTSDHSKIQWSKPSLTFEADIVIDSNDTGFINKIDVADSPITIADGESLYVILERMHDTYLTPVVASAVPAVINAFRIATRFGDNIILWDNTLIRDGKAVRVGEGGEGGTARVDLYDPVSTTLPSGASATIDGVSLTNGMLVLFSNLSVDANRIYKAAGVGTSITWTAQSSWSTGLDPVLSDDVIVMRGTAFGLQRGIFDGSDFSFNDTVRYFSGTDYWEVSSLKTFALTASTTASLFTITLAGSENLIVDYSIIRGTRKETGTLHITSDGTSVAVTTSGAYIGASGVTFSGDISAGTLRVRYTADGSSGIPTVKYYVRRWSDSPGGPAGIPSYSGGVSGIAAAGSNTQIQYNDSGNFGADADFTWDKTNNVLTIANLNITGLATATLADNTASPAVAFQYSASTYPFVVIEFSIKRDTQYQVGRMLIVSDGTTASITVDSTNASGDPGITFSVDISAGQVRLLYTSTSTTFTPQLKYSMRRWT